ncbi:hypothetical protein FRC00_005471 [Tulasnella sp. 408]|nr:hypothetical protein FRC00_005471 [Tulasnella sp. 408]
MSSVELRTATLGTEDQTIFPPPRSRLPLELITIILKLCFPKDYRWADDMAEIYGLRLVSKLWKELVEGLPWFWTSISARYPTTVIRDCLRLSRDHLLRVRIFSSWLLNSGSKDLAKKIQILQAHAERWEQLDYNTSRLPVAEVRGFLEAPAPNLQSLSARLPDDSSPPPTLNLAGGKAEQLKHLSLENVLLPWSSQLLTGLETFSLTIEDIIPVEEIVNIFIKSPCLRTFHLSYRSVGGPGVPAFPASTDSNPLQVTASALEEVNLSFNDSGIASHVLSRVSMPVCRSLKLVIESLDMDNIHPLNTALSQFTPKIGQGMSQGGRTKLYIWPEDPTEWRISSQEDAFEFSLDFSGFPLNRFIEWARELALASASQLELEVYLGTTDRWIANELGGWSEITKLRVASTSQAYYDQQDEVLLFPDYLGQAQMDPAPGLSWPFPNLQELDLSDLKYPLLKVLDMLNRRYLSGPDVERMEDSNIAINTPPKMDIRVRDALEWEDTVIVPVLESHRSVKSLEYGSLEM